MTWRTLRRHTGIHSHRNRIERLIPEVTRRSVSEIRPVDRDTFQISRVTVRFQRDQAGKVVGFDYSNPLIRNIKFTRLSDGTSSIIVRAREAAGSIKPGVKRSETPGTHR